MLGEAISPSWCLKCGYYQKTDHLGTQACRKCGSREWMDIESWERYVKANKAKFEQMGRE